MRLKYIVFILTILLAINSHSQAEVWTQLPLRTLVQKNAGLFGGEGMQMIFGITYAPSNSNVIYLVSDTSQVWKSEDGGNSWKMINKGFKANGGIDIVVDPLNENIVFVCGAQGDTSGLISSSADGIYRTQDSGQNWQLVKQTSFFRGKEGTHFVFDTTGGIAIGKTKIIYAGTHKDGLLVSVDSGDNWNFLDFKDERILDLKINPVNLSILYLLSVKGFYKITLDNYAISTIENLGNDLPKTYKTFVINPNNSQVMYIACGKNGVYKSQNEGINFVKLSNGLVVDIDYSQIAISKVNTDYLYVSIENWGWENPFWSHDAGNSWNRPVTLDKNNNSITQGRFFSAQIATYPQNANIAITSTNGAARIIKTEDGGNNWFYSGNGYTGGCKGVGINSQAHYTDNKKMIFFLIDFGPAYTADNGETFKLLNIPRIDGLKTSPVGSVTSNSDSSIIATAIGGWTRQKIVVSHDNGENWEIISNTEDNYKFIAFHPQKPNIVYAQNWKSTDYGKTWNKLSKPILAMFQSNGDSVYSTYKDEQGLRILQSDDGGDRWISSFKIIKNIYGFNELAIDPLNKNRLYIASNSGFFIYDGYQWIKKGEESGLTKDSFGQNSFKCVAIDPKHPEVVYTGKWAPGQGQSNGIFRSKNYGETWENISYNLKDNFSVWSISVNPFNGIVYLGSTHGTWTISPPY